MGEGERAVFASIVSQIDRRIDRGVLLKEVQMLLSLAYLFPMGDVVSIMHLSLLSAGRIAALLQAKSVHHFRNPLDYNIQPGCGRFLLYMVRRS